MASKDGPSGILYAPVPLNPNSANYVVSPLYHHTATNPYRLRLLRRCILFSFSFLLLCVALYLLWPSDPELQIVRVELNHIQVRTSPKLSLDLSLSLSVRVKNRDLFSLDYDSLVVSIDYRSRELGFVKSSGGHLKAKRSSYVNATLVLDGLEVLHDIFYFIEDVVEGSLPLDTVTMIHGKLGLFGLKIPLKAKVSCELFVNPNNQKIIHQNCYPE
ncbi:hypothetical protein Ancab_016787 [Ancistrocladus abbreviatus]